MAGGESLSWLQWVFGDGGDLITLVETNAVRDALPSVADSTRGVVVFSHGYRGIRYQSTFLTTWLASHGYVVFAPDHAGNTLLDGSEDDWTSTRNRILDVAALTDLLTAEQGDPNSFLHGQFDPTRLAWIGHSFGASTALMAGAQDNREMLVVPLAPAFDERMAGVWAQPSYDLRAALMVLGGSEDTTTEWPMQELAYERTFSPRHLVQFGGLRHFDFTDLCTNELFRFATSNFVEELAGACGDDPTAYHESVRESVTAAMHRYVGCDEGANAWLDGLSSRPQIALSESERPAPIGTASPAAHGTLDPTTWDANTRWFDTQAGTFRVREYQVDAPGRAIVMVHDLSVDSRAFEPLVERIASDHPVTLVDLPGHAGTGAAGDVTRWGEGLQSVLLDLDLDAPVLLGWGLGGALVLEVAAQSDLTALVLVGTSASNARDWTHIPDWNGGQTLVHRADLLRDSPAAAHHMVAPRAPLALQDKIRALWAETPASTRTAVLDQEGVDVLEVAPSVSTPTLLVHGEQDDAVLLESSTWLAHTLPASELHVFQRSGHMPFAEEPDAFARLLVAFIDAQ